MSWLETLVHWVDIVGKLIGDSAQSDKDVDGVISTIMVVPYPLTCLLSYTLAREKVTRYSSRTHARRFILIL